MPSSSGKENCVKRLYNAIKHSISQNGLALPGLLQGSIWIIGLAMLIFATAKDCKSVLADYRHNNEATQINVPLNISIPAPQLALAIPHYLNEKKDNLDLMVISRHLFDGTEINCTECQKLAQQSWDVWKGMNIRKPYYESVDQVYNALSLAFVRLLLDKIETNETHLATSEQWQEAVVTSAMNFFQWETQLDVAFTDKIIDFGAGTDSVSNILRSYEKKSVDKLWSHVLYYFCKHNSFMVVSDYNSSESDWIKRDLSCSRYLQAINIPHSFSSSSFYIPLAKSNDMEKYYAEFTLWNGSNTNDKNIWTSINKRRSLDIYSDPAYLYLSALEKGYNAPIDSGVLDNEKWTETHLIYTATAKFQEKRKEILGKCFNETNSKICISKCYKQWIMENCKCIPFIYSKALPKNKESSMLSYCNKTLYSLCDPWGHQDTLMSKCANQCGRPCTYWTYNWMAKRETRSYGKQVGFEINILPANNPIVEFFWVEKTSTEQFLASIGGTLGLYLGLSGLSLCMFLISFIDFIRQCQQSRKDHAEQQAGVQPISKWQKVLLGTMPQMQEDPSASSSGEIEFATKPQMADATSNRFLALEKRMNKLESKMDQMIQEIDQIAKIIVQKLEK